jgi:hypothetical protein
MYRNPFWKDRFGDRGERHSHEDHAHHVRYVVEAMRANRSEIVADYARWLQSLLTTRGMCTLHVEESFLRVSDAIAAEGLDDARESAPFIEAATRALRHPEARAEARAIQDASAALADAATSAALRDGAHAAAVDDALYLVSYAADAVALGSDTIFVSYVVWRAGFLERRQLPPRALTALVRALHDASPVLPADVRARFSALTARALEALERGAS